MAIRITDGRLTLEIGERVVATVRFSEHAANDGSARGILSRGLFARDQAITALTVDAHRRRGG